MQFQVPQNIAMEDRIVGPLTLIQFIIVLVGGGISFVFINMTSAPPILTRGLAIFFAILTLVIALGKFNDQPMYRFFRYIIAFIITPKTRIWHKGGSEVRLIKPSQHMVSNQSQHVAKKVSKSDLARLATVLDSRGKSGVLPQMNPIPPKPPAK